MIKAVFFDYDGVLTTDRSGSLTTYRYLSRATGIAFSTINTAFSRYGNDLLLGKVSYAEIWHEACEALGVDLDIGLLHEAFESTPVNSGMFSLARRLKVSHAVGIITDNKKDRMDCLKRCQALESLFNPIVVSAEVGASKESPEIFLYALKRAGVAPDESIFIDNNKANLLAPSALGLSTVFHDDDKNDIGALIQKLKTLGAHVGDS